MPTIPSAAFYILMQVFLVQLYSDWKSLLILSSSQNQWSEKKNFEVIFCAFFSERRSSLACISQPISSRFYKEMQRIFKRVPLNGSAEYWIQAFIQWPKLNLLPHLQISVFTWIAKNAVLTHGLDWSWIGQLDYLVRPENDHSAIVHGVASEIKS